MSKIFKVSIQGMSCSACVGRIEKSVAALPQVQRVAVNLLENMALVSISEASTPAPLAGVEEGILNTIRSLGYQAAPYADAASKAGASAMSWRLVVGVVCWLPFMVDMLGWSVPYFHNALVPFVLASLVQWYSGWDFHKKTILGLKRRAVDMNTLVTLGSFSAYGLSIGQALAGQHAHYFESSVAIITFILLGKWLELLAKRRALEGLVALDSLYPKTVSVVGEAGAVVEVPTALLKSDEVVVVGPFEKIPADGVVVEGTTHVSNAHITGESALQRKSVGDSVLAGALNEGGLVRVRTTHVGADSTVGRLVALMQSARLKKTAFEAYADRVVTYFVPVILVISFATLFWGVLVGGETADYVLRAVSVLVVACPCALGLATPVVSLVAVNYAFRRSILIRDLDAVQSGVQITAMAFDKTGTLTEKNSRISAVLVAEGRQKDEVVLLAASLEQFVQHPLARAFKAALQERLQAGGVYCPVAELLEEKGLGVHGTIDGRRYVIGGWALVEKTLRDNLDTNKNIYSYINSIKDNYKVFLLDVTEVDVVFLAAFQFEESLKREAHSLIRYLEHSHISPVILSGDQSTAVEKTANELGVRRWFAALNPEQKVQHLEQLRGVSAKHAGQDLVSGAGQERVAMIGDGVNDAAVLAAADLSFAMGSGTDIAASAAQITILDDNLMRVAQSFEILKAAYKKIKQNLFWAFAYNIVLVPLAVMGKLNPMWASFAMGFSSVTVVVNALIFRPDNPLQPNQAFHPRRST